MKCGMSRSYKMHFNCTWKDIICSHFSCTWTKCVSLMEAELFVCTPFTLGGLSFAHFKCKGGLSMPIGLEDPLNLYGWKWLESVLHMLSKNLSVYSLTYPPRLSTSKPGYISMEGKSPWPWPRIPEKRAADIDTLYESSLQLDLNQCWAVLWFLTGSLLEVSPGI